MATIPEARRWGMPSSAPRLLLAVLAPVLLATVVGLVVLWPSGERGEQAADLGAPTDLIDAEVLGVDRGTCEGTPPEAALECSRSSVRLLEGPDKGEVVTLPEQSESGLGPRLESGDRVVLSYLADVEERFRYSFADFERRTPLYLLGAVFVVAVIGLGRWQGVRALVALSLSLAVLAVFVLPAVLDGSSPLAVALVGAALIAVISLYLSHGVSNRTTVALVGTLTSLALVGVLGSLFVAAADFTGLADEEATYLQIFAGQVDLRGLLLGGVVIGALGVLDDVTVTQVSAVWELRQANPSYGFGDLYRAGLRIGRDHVASTVNTLVLAYAGASLPLLLLFTEAEQRLIDVLNGEVVAVEVVRTLVGSIGLVASVPITTALAALVVSGGQRVERPYKDRRELRFWQGADLT